MNPKVCISVLNWNNYDQTIDCLKSLTALDYPNYRIVVVDNASRDDSVERIRLAFPAVELVCADTNLGYAGGNELALRRALADGETELFWILNNDALAHPDSLSRFVAAYRQYGDAIYGGVPLAPESQTGEWMIQMVLRSIDPRSGALVLTRLDGLPYHQYFASSEPRPTAVVDGSTMLIPLSVVRQYGFMDTDLFMYSEEADFCLRLSKWGIKIILVPGSAIFHARAGSRQGQSNLDNVLRYYQTRNRLIVRWRHSTKVSYVRLLLDALLHAVTTGALALLGRPGKAEQSRFLFRAFYDGLRRKTGRPFLPEDYL